jgi:TetR/AcrR family fatty acid metabolism transcriptional regulator
MGNRGAKEDTKNRIIESAKKLFAEQGYQKTTVVDISKQAGLSEAALYEYFQGKEDLLLAIPDLWVSDLLADVQGQLFGIKGAVNKLRKYLWWNLRRIEQAPLDAKIVYLFLKTNANFMNTPVYANVRNLYAHILNIFEEGQKTGEMKAAMNPYAARDIFVGTMDHIVTRWLLKDMSYSLFDNLDSIFDLMVSAFLENHANVSAALQERGVDPPVKTENNAGGYSGQQQPRDQEG